MGYTPFKMKYKNLEEVVEQLQGAVKAHGNQAKVIQKHIDKMENSPLPKKNKEGKEQGADGKACWDGYKYAGTENGKDKCVPI
tara:strand:- start:255 stop:503 length:249 start_codon:yes stop_codon:yes gene_type:complete